jgi:heme-degrading monooxygenase HmoA
MYQSRYSRSDFWLVAEAMALETNRKKFRRICRLETRRVSMYKFSSNRFIVSICAFIALVSLFAVAQQSKVSGPEKVVARIWHGVVPKARANEYEKYLYEAGMKSILTVKGNLGAQMMRRDNASNTEFEVISYWPSRKAIEAFAGKDIEKTHHLPRDKEFLVNIEPTVRHFDVLFEQRR